MQNLLIRNLYFWRFLKQIWGFLLLKLDGRNTFSIFPGLVWNVISRLAILPIEKRGIFVFLLPAHVLLTYWLKTLKVGRGSLVIKLGGQSYYFFYDKKKVLTMVVQSCFCAAICVVGSNALKTFCASFQRLCTPQ